jgi:hypothetical protein
MNTLMFDQAGYLLDEKAGRTSRRNVREHPGICEDLGQCSEAETSIC